MSDDIVLKVVNLNKKYNKGIISINNFRNRNEDTEFWAIKDFNLEVKRGEIVGIIGQNGAGKSTLLKIISRITSPTSGEIYLDGKISSLLEVGTGFHPELTGRENIYLNGSILGMRRSEINDKLDSIIDFSECREFIDTPVKRYSSGMYVRLAFSVAVHLKSDILIMDEVLSVGDVQFQKKCLDKIKKISEGRERTILYVSHNIETVKRLCDRCIVIEKGKKIFDGLPIDAISIYMGNVNLQSDELDLSCVMRPGWLHRNDVRISCAKYIEKNNDKLRLALEFKVNNLVEHVSVRIEISDEERTFATALITDLFSAKQGEIVYKDMNIDLSTVMNGHYHTKYTVFIIDPFGNSIDLDCITGLDIWIEHKSKVNELIWKNDKWGNVCLKLRGIE